MNSIKLITFFSLLTISLSSNAFIGIKNITEEHPLAIDSQNDEFKKEVELLNRLIRHIKKTPIKTEIISSNKEKSEIQVNWYMNKKTITPFTKFRLTLYTGEDKEKTSSVKFNTSNQTNKLYFYDKPLGQNNGLTWKLRNNTKTSKIIKKIFKNTKGFIKVQYKDQINFIPLLTTAPANRCGDDIFNETPEILCLQTSTVNPEQLNIGYKQGFSNRITYPNLITDPNQITLSFKFFYKGEEI